jgi:hypothetical protein
MARMQEITNKAITNEEIAEYVIGEATNETARRVVSAALLDSHVAEKLTVAYGYDTKISDAEVAETRAVAQKTRGSILALVHQKNDTINTREALLTLRGGLFRQGKELQESITAWSNDVLQVGRQLLTLPCLAPATAAATVEHSLRRESITTAEGIRVEFQQLPGETPRLRLVLDASIWAERGYTRGFITLAEGEDRHILIVALNAQGRGFTDFVIGNNNSDAPLAMPPARHGMHLVSVSLAKE